MGLVWQNPIASYLQTNIIAQVLSAGGEERNDVNDAVSYVVSFCSPKTFREVILVAATWRSAMRLDCCWVACWKLCSVSHYGERPVSVTSLFFARTKIRKFVTSRLIVAYRFMDDRKAVLENCSRPQRQIMDKICWTSPRTLMDSSRSTSENMQQWLHAFRTHTHCYAFSTLYF